jgi:magnesium-protoporphyrin IX monomethyl ester (oxidative) cyclase
MQQHVVLINPPALKGHSNERTYSGGIGVSRKLKPGEKEGPIILPIDFLYTGAVAEKCGAKVTFVDLLIDRFWGEEAEQFCQAQIGETDEQTWIGVRLSIPSLLDDLLFANRMKELMPKAKVFVFGTVIMATIDHWIRECKVDFLIYGEPEGMFAELLKAPDWRKVPGVIQPKFFIPLAGMDLYDAGKQTSKYGSWLKVKNLSELPRPAWHLLDMKRYSPDGKDTSQVHVFIQASRGCPIGCNMCPYMLLEGKPWRSADITGVVDEIEYLNKTYGIYKIRFRDPNFGFNRKYARELCEAIIERGVKLEATVETSVEVFDEDNLSKMYEAGMRTITTGIETNDAECMASIGQKISVNEKLRERIDFCHKLGFHIYGTYCLGMPEETWATVRKTWMFAKELSVESGFTVLTPFPGTPMYWRALEEGLIPKEMRFSDWNSYTSTMRTNNLSTRDLDIARLWSRLETIIPYRRATAGKDGFWKGWVSFYWKHLPHYAVRQLIRAYVWYQESRNETSGQPKKTSPPSAERAAA